MKSMPIAMGAFLQAMGSFFCFSLTKICFIWLSLAISGSNLLVAAVPMDYRVAVDPFTTDVKV